MGPDIKTHYACNGQQQIKGLQAQSHEASRMGAIEHYGESAQP
jgi:hypothetical protein